MNAGDTAWVLISASLVLLMTPGLAFFYGGLTSSKGVLNMIMMSFGAIGVVGVLWVLFGYSTAFGRDVFGGLLGDPLEKFGLAGVLSTGKDMPLVGTVPEIAFAGFQAVFAIITVALISGSIADRAKFGAWLLFAAIWVTIVYFPVAHWVFDLNKDASANPIGGWIGQSLGAIDFAGGTAVHINAGAAGLALALVLGKRVGFGSTPAPAHKPHNLPFVLLGAGLLWFGWFGFNAGSALAANGTAGYAWVNTLAAPAAGILGWLVVERLTEGHTSPIGAASGAISGLVGITPAASAVAPGWAIVLGLLAGVACALAVNWKYRLGYDDSLDVVGVHLVGGLIGTLFIGLAADPGSPAGARGLFYGGGFELLGKQALGSVAVLVYSFGLSWVIGTVIAKTIGFRVKTEHELAGVDLVLHKNQAYEFIDTAGLPVVPKETASAVSAPSTSADDAGTAPRRDGLAHAVEAAATSAPARRG